MTSARVMLTSSLIVAFAVAVLLPVLGPTLVVLAPWDIFIDLDEGWRLFLGQVPNTDFHTPVGPLRFLLIAIGIWVSGPGLQAVVVSDVLFLLVAAPLAAFVAFRRLRPVPAFLFVVFVTLLAAAARQVGRGVDIPGYIEFYNRFGWALLCVLILQLLFARLPDLRPRPFAEGLVVGFLIAALVFMKITFGVVGLLVLVFALLRQPGLRAPRLLVGVAVAAIGVTIAVVAATGMNPFAYAADVLDSVRAQTLERRSGSIRGTFKRVVPFLALLVLAWVLLVLLPARGGRIPRRAAIQVTITASFIVVCGLLVAFWNAGEGGEVPPLLLAGLAMLSPPLGGSEAGAPELRRGRGTTVALVAVVAIGAWTAVQDAASIAMTAVGREYRVAGAPAAQRFDAVGLADYVIPADVDWVSEIWRSADVPTRVNDGLAFLRPRVRPDRSVLTLAFANIYPYALGVRPPRGVPTFFDLNNNFNAAHRPAPEALFADVDFVAIPIIRDGDDYRGGRDTVDTLLAIYGPYLTAHYAEAGRSQYWVLLAKR